MLSYYRLKLLFIVVLAQLFAATSGSKILAIFQHPGFSHFKSFSLILHSLAERGHNVTVVSHFPTKDPPSSYQDIILGEHYPLNSYSLNTIRPTSAFRKGLYEFLFLQDIGQKACEAFFESDAMNQIRKSHAANPFDLIIMEVFNTDCILGVAHVMQKPYVALSSCVLMPWHYDRVGLPDFPSFISQQFAGFADKMSFPERVLNFVVTRGMKLLYRTTELADNAMIQKYLNISIDVRDVAKDVSLILTNQHYSIHGARPLTSRVVEVGGVHVSGRNSPVSTDLNRFLENSKHGAIFISWGSLVNISTLPADKLKGMINGLENLKENIIFKWDSEIKPTESTKFFITKWVKQNDVLCHPKVRLFWSHGGLLGTSESVHCAVPMVITPMYGDQYLNAKAIQNRKMGEILNYEDITEENVYNIISKVLQPDYARNAKYVSDVYRNRQNPPLETALWWIEHVIHTGGSNLTYSPSVDLNWFTYYSLDAIIVLLLVALIILLIPLICIRKCVSLLRKRCSSCAVPTKNISKRKKKFT